VPTQGRRNTLKQGRLGNGLVQTHQIDMHPVSEQPGRLAGLDTDRYQPPLDTAGIGDKSRPPLRFGHFRTQIAGDKISSVWRVR
jgi:hypothetical protein